MGIYQYKNGDDIEYYDNLCECGHALYLHGFVHLWSLNVLHTSQCTFCSWHDDENGKRVPDCSHFRGSITKHNENRSPY